MQSNPMQRKTRNAFLGGMLIMLVLAAIIVVIVYFMFLKDVISIGQKEGETMVVVYKLASDIKSGTPITEASIITTKMSSSDVPLNYATSISEDMIAKVDLYTGTILTTSVLCTDETDSNVNSLRLAEFNMITLPSTLRVGDYIDVRLTIPSGQDFIVLAKKRVMSLQSTTIGLYLTEDEIITINCAIIESYIMTASNLWAIQYIDPGIQEAATVTYPLNSSVYAQAQSNSNILQEAKNALTKRMNDGGTTLRNNYINSDLSQYQSTNTENIETGLQKQIETASELYLSGLSGY